MKKGRANENHSSCEALSSPPSLLHSPPPSSHQPCLLSPPPSPAAPPRLRSPPRYASWRQQHGAGKPDERRRRIGNRQNLEVFFYIVDWRGFPARRLFRSSTETLAVTLHPRRNKALHRPQRPRCGKQSPSFLTKFFPPKKRIKKNSVGPRPSPRERPRAPPLPRPRPTTRSSGTSSAPPDPRYVS
jgi:hypothetical protein